MFKALKKWLDEPLISRKSHLLIYLKRVMDESAIGLNYSNQDMEVKLIGIDALRLGRAVSSIREDNAEKIEEGFVIAEKLSNDLKYRLKILGIYEDVVNHYESTLNEK